MKLVSIIRRAFMVGLGSAIALLLVAVALVRIEERILQRRAERLLVDIRLITLQNSSLDEAKLRFRRWGKYERNWSRDRETSCDGVDCVFAISLADFFWSHPGVFSRPWITRAYLFVGGRAARIDANVHVKDGRVSDEYISTHTLATGSPDGVYDVAASAHGWGMDDPSPVTSTPNHYRIGQAANCWPCIFFDFSSQIDEVNLRRLLVFDFSCLTRASGCHSPGDVMPNVWADFAAQQNGYCASRIESELRRAWNIGSFDVIASHSAPRGEFANVRLSYLWRGDASFRAGSKYDVYLSAPVNAEGVRSGTKLIILFLDLFPEHDNSIMPTQCGTMYENQSSLSLVRAALTAQVGVPK